MLLLPLLCSRQAGVLMSKRWVLQRTMRMLLLVSI